MSRSIAEMRNLGPATAQWLREIDVHNEDDLRALGAVAAWQRLRFVFGRPVSIIALYAMEAALIGCDWRALTLAQKTALKQAAKKGQPTPQDKPGAAAL